MTLNFKEICNYIIFDNPVSKTMTSATRSLLGTALEQNPQRITVIKQDTPLWELAAKNGPYVRIAGVMGASAAILGAYGAHKAYPKDKVNELKPIYETANRYHFFHTLALFAVPLGRHPKITAPLLITGTILFSGACYYHAFTGEKKFDKVAPIGGTLLILGWLSFVL